MALGRLIGRHRDVFDRRIPTAFLFDRGELAYVAVAGVEHDVGCAAQSVARRGRKQRKTFFRAEQFHELLLLLGPHAELIERFELDIRFVELHHDPFAGGRSLGTERRGVSDRLIFGGEGSHLPVLPILGIQAAEQFDRFERGVTLIARLGFAGQPHAVDHCSERDALLGIIEHDRRGPGAQPFGQDFTHRAEAERLPRQQQPGGVRTFVGTTGRVEYYRDAAFMQIRPFCRNLHPDLVQFRGKPIAEMLWRHHAPVVVDLFVSQDDVGRKRRDIRDHQQRKADPEGRNQP